MGNTESTEGHTQAFEDEILKNFQLREKHRKDDRYGDISIYNHKHNPHDLLVFVDKWTNTDAEAKQLYSLAKERGQISHPNIAKMMFKEVVRDDQGLNSFHKFTMGFEYHNQNLAKELHERKHIYDYGDYENSSMKFFSEAEIWYLISSFASVIKTFENHGYHHGDIQPQNILVDPSGFVKILDNSLVNYGKTGYHKMVFDAKYTTALSPILIDSLKERELNPRHDKVKSDIFSLGITALCAATNTNVNHYYDWVNKRVRMAYRSIGETPTPGSLKNTVDDDLDRMQNIIGYSPQLVNTIRAMLHENEADRIGIDELISFLSQNQGHNVQAGKDTFARSHSINN